MIADASPRSQIRVLDHVAPVLFVAGQPTRERERVHEGPPDELVKSLPVARLRGADQLGFVQSGLPCRGLRPFDQVRPQKVTPPEGSGGVDQGESS